MRQLFLDTRLKITLIADAPYNICPDFAQVVAKIAEISDKWRIDKKQ